MRPFCMNLGRRDIVPTEVSDMLFNLPFEFYSLKMGKRVCNIGEDTGCAPIEELVCSIN